MRNVNNFRDEPLLQASVATTSAAAVAAAISAPIPPALWSAVSPMAIIVPTIGHSVRKKATCKKEGLRSFGRTMGICIMSCCY